MCSLAEFVCNIHVCLKNNYYEKYSTGILSDANVNFYFERLYKFLLKKRVISFKSKAPMEIERVGQNQVRSCDKKHGRTD